MRCLLKSRIRISRNLPFYKSYGSLLRLSDSVVSRGIGALSRCSFRMIGHCRAGQISDRILTGIFDSRAIWGCQPCQPVKRDPGPPGQLQQQAEAAVLPHEGWGAPRLRPAQREQLRRALRGRRQQHGRPAEDHEPCGRPLQGRLSGR